MCDSATESERPLPVSISKEKNGVLNLCWDNFDMSGTTYYATHGIAIQQLELETENSMYINNSEKQTEKSYNRYGCKPVNSESHFSKEKEISFI